MARGVDANGEPARDGETGPREPRGELTRSCTSGGSRAAGADHRELRRPQGLDGSQHEQYGRRACCLRQQRRIACLAAQNDLRAARLKPFEVRAQRALVGRQQELARGGRNLGLAQRARFANALNLALRGRNE